MTEPEHPRQRIIRTGKRRAVLTAAPDTIQDADWSESASNPTNGPNDERLRADVPPHY